MKKSLLLLFVLGAVTINLVFAETIDKELAAKIAMNFCMKSSKIKASDEMNLTLAYTENAKGISTGKSSNPEAPLFYIFNINQNNGFVMISADNDVTPILGYTTSGSFTGKNMPHAFMKLMELYKEEIRYVIINHLKADNAIASRWQSLENGQPLNTAKNAKTVNPLLSTTWNQNPYENEMCPADPAGPGGHCVTGCPATAMAQIMKFWNYPTTGTGFHSYNASNSNGDYGTLSADFGGTTYDWASMPLNLTSSNSAVALLMLHCGVAVEMNYGPNGSGGWVIENDQNGNHAACSEIAYKTYFGYASSLNGHQRSEFSDADWKQKLMTDLDAGRPVQYAGWGTGGHTFVCDGYDQNEFFDMNWGWGGEANGFFNLDALNPGTDDFNSSQQAIFGIQPGQSGGSASITLYDAISASPDPISYAAAFTVHTNLINTGTSAFAGDYTAALFTSDGTFVDFIQTLTETNLQPNYYYTNGLDFATTGIPAATPGTYYIGIYFRPTGGGWTLAGDGSYTNLISVTIQGYPNDIGLYTNIVLDHNIIVGQPFTATTKIANSGSSNFSGYVSLDLHALDGTWIQAIQEYPSVSLQAGYYNTFPFSSTGLNVAPGEYLLVAWDQPSGGSMQLVSGATYSNPIKVVISGQPLAPDVYEPNNTEATARLLSPTYNKAMVNYNTAGSTIHSSDDVDYYKVDLPTGYTYTVNARVHDSYDSGNGQVYTADVMFNVAFAGQVSDTYDTYCPTFTIDGGELTFEVFPYFPGEIGSYLLDVNVDRNPIGIETIDANSKISVFPNPAKDVVTFRINLSQPEIISGNLTNIFGQQVMEIAKASYGAGKSDVRLDVSSLQAGCYFYEFETINGKTTGKLVITK